MSSCYCCVCWFFMRGKSGPGSVQSTVSWCLPGSLTATSCSADAGGQTADRSANPCVVPSSSFGHSCLKVTLSAGIHPQCPGFQFLPALLTGPLSQQVEYAARRRCHVLRAESGAEHESLGCKELPAAAWKVFLFRACGVQICESRDAALRKAP